MQDLSLTTNAFTSTPIVHDYSQPATELLAALKSQQTVVLMENTDRIKIGNDYWQQQLPGSIPKLYTRKVVWQQLQLAANLLPKNTALYIFDAFRTLKTQTYLFNAFKTRIAKQNPKLSAEELEQLARRYVSHPSDPSHYPIPLHNSGGAIDLQIIDLTTNKAWDFGTDIDVTEYDSGTDFYEADYQPDTNYSKERWLTARQNRRFLFHAMKSVGFVNYRNEWWHYDLGDCNWAKELQRDWVFPSMEQEVQQCLQQR